jgi:2-iminobutanoate/2-iminopropanoate deaminase
MKTAGAVLLSLCVLQVTGFGQAPAKAPQAPATAPQAPAAGRRVVAPAGPFAAGSYSPGVQVGPRLFLAGQLGRDPKSGELPAGIAAQTKQAMENIGAVLGAAGMDHRHLVACHVYLGSMDDYVGMNQTYASFFKGRVPARTTIEAAGLPRNAAVEIGCVAHADLAAISVVEVPKGSLPAPLGPYTAAVWAGDTLYLSGMGGQFPEDRRLPEPLGDQMTQALVNIRTTLTAAKVGTADVVSSTTYFTEPGGARDAASAYDPVFASAARPPRSVIVVPRLPGAIKTEITFVAARPGTARRVLGGDEGAARGVLAGGVLYTRGESAPQAGPGFEAQFEAALGKLQDTVREAGLPWANVAHVHVALSDLADFATMDRIFRERFPSAPPARTTIGVTGAPGTRVQVSLVAVE